MPSYRSNGLLAEKIKSNPRLNLFKEINEMGRVKSLDRLFSKRSKQESPSSPEKILEAA